MLKSFRLQITVLAFLVVVCCLYGSYLYRSTHPKPGDINFRLPKDGLTENDTQGKVPGNPENGHRTLLKLYGFYQMYQRKHGSLPNSFGDMFMDLIKTPKPYGVSDLSEMDKAIANPDVKYSDNAMERTGKMFTFGGDAVRPDKTPKFSAKKAGTKDILASKST